MDSLAVNRTVDFAIPDARPMPIVESQTESPTVASAEHVRRFDAIFEAHYDFVWRTLRRLGVNDASVDDSAQEVFVVVAKRLGEIEIGFEKSFLFGTARRVAAAARRQTKAQAEPISERSLDKREADAPSPEEALGTRRAQEMLVEILDTMDEDVREAFILFELEGLSKTEVAAMLAIPEGTAASRLRRGREHFLAQAQRLRARIETNEKTRGVRS